MHAAAKHTALAAISVVALLAVGLVGSAGGARSGSGDRVAPTMPPNLHVTRADANLVRIAWDPAADAVGVVAYYVYTEKGRASVDGTSYVLRGLDCGQSLGVEVAAFDRAGNISERASTTVATAGCPDTEPPSAPSGIWQAATTQTAVVLRWNASLDNVGVIGYGVYRNITLVTLASEPSVTLSGLACGTTYTYDIDAIDAMGLRSPRTTAYVRTASCNPSPSPADTTPPSKPALSLGPRTQTSLELDWQAGTDNVGIHHYNVWLGRSGAGDFAPVKQVSPASRSYVYSGLTCGTDYALGLEAVDAAGNKSQIAEATWQPVRTTECQSQPPSPSPADTTPPSKPVLSLGARTQTSLELEWQAGTDDVGVDHYNVWLGRSGAGDFAPVKQVSADARSYVYPGLTCATDYALGLEAADAAGNKSQIAEATWQPVRTNDCSSPTPQPRPTPPPDTTPPTQPGNPSISGATQASVSLAWAPSQDNVGVAGYRTYVDDTAGTTTTQASATENGLACGTAYRFAVEAYDAAGNKSPRSLVLGSSAACADTRPPTAPGSVAATSRTATSIALSWSPSTDDDSVAGYGLYQGGTRIAATNQTTSIFSGLACNTNYTLGVDAYDPSGNRSQRTTVMVSTTACQDTTPPAKPTLSLGARTQTSVELDWQAGTDNVGVDHYNVWFGRYGAGNFAPVKQVSATTLSFVQTGLTCGTDYSLGLEVVDAAGNKSQIAEATWQPVRTTDCPAAPAPSPAPAPAPAPAPTPSGGSGTPIDDISDLTAVFNPSWTQPATQGGSGGGGMWPVSTPLGPGFKFIATDQMPAPWDSTCKVVLAQQRPATSPIGRSERWQFSLMIPNQTLPQTWHSGVLWQWHTEASSGHNLALNSDGTFRIVQQTGAGLTYAFHQGPRVRFGSWIPVVFEIKWSYGSDGYLRIYIDGQKYLDYSGATLFGNEHPYLQFGWYAQRMLTNEVWFADIRHT